MRTAHRIGNDALGPRMEGYVAPATACSSVLPEDALAWLREAAAVTNTATDQSARTRAVEQAVARIRSKYPQHLQPED